MKKIHEESILVILSALLVAAIIVIFLLLPNTETPRSRLLVEIAKILTAGLIIGILSVWVKQLFEKVIMRRENEKATFARKKELFQLLRRATREAYDGVDDEKHQVGNFNILFKSDNNDFEDLLDEWEAFEPDGPVIKVRNSYKKLKEEFNNESKLTGSLREDIKKAALEWYKEFAAYAVGSRKLSID
jgi:hypothetical protein